ncbi:nuclease-related domain-containing protein [Arthrobacter sp. H5]|uniref:nuclease-related domain-containing protein n=1 Tax=Arthrobacter sp. H5 TaxID=1267973 RepID=UPI0004B397B6|nr:nuclease-related domain-containing protein [Arthrobacter sp. H5]
MRCIPEEPQFADGQSAEPAVWETLRASLPDDAVLAHSVQVRNGRAEHEIDLLILWPGVGLAAIEVKGGLVTVDKASGISPEAGTAATRCRAPWPSHKAQLMPSGIGSAASSERR